MATTRRPRLNSTPPPDGVTLSREQFEELSENANALRSLVPVSEPDFDVAPEETATDRVASMLSGIAPDERAEVKLYLVTGPNKFEWADDFDVPTFEAGGYKMIRERFGAGTYQIRLYATHPEHGRFVIRAKENVTILPVKDSQGAAPAQSGANGELAQMVRALAESQQRMFDALASRPVVDQKANMREMLETMALMKTVMGSDKPASGLAEQLALIRELKGVAQEFGDAPPPPEPSLTSMLPDVLKLVQTGMSQNRSPAPVAAYAAPMVQPQARAVSSPVTQNPVTTQAAPFAPPIPNNEQELMIAELNKKLAELVSMAEANAPIERGADLVYEFLPDEIIEIMRRDDWLEMVGKFAPKLLDYAQWTTGVRNAALAIFDEPVDAFDSTGPDVDG